MQYSCQNDWQLGTFFHNLYLSILWVKFVLSNIDAIPIPLPLRARTLNKG